MHRLIVVELLWRRVFPLAEILSGTRELLRAQDSGPLAVLFDLRLAPELQALQPVVDQPAALLRPHWLASSVRDHFILVSNLGVCLVDLDEFEAAASHVRSVERSIQVDEVLPGHAVRESRCALEEGVSKRTDVIWLRVVGDRIEDQLLAHRLRPSGWASPLALGAADSSGEHCLAFLPSEALVQRSFLARSAPVRASHKLLLLSHDSELSRDLLLPLKLTRCWLPANLDGVVRGGWVSTSIVAAPQREQLHLVRVLSACADAWKPLAGAVVGPALVPRAIREAVSALRVPSQDLLCIIIEQRELAALPIAHLVLILMRPPWVQALVHASLPVSDLLQPLAVAGHVPGSFLLQGPCLGGVTMVALAL